MVFTDQPLGINGSLAHLLPVNLADQPLVARIFSAHAACLRVFSVFSRTKSERFLHSFLFNGGGSPAFFIRFSPFVVPYALSPLFATLTKTAGVYLHSSHSGTDHRIVLILRNPHAL